VIRLGNGCVTIAVDAPDETQERLSRYFNPWLQRSDDHAEVLLSLQLARDVGGVGPVLERVERLRNENTGVVRFADRLAAPDGVEAFRIDTTGSVITVVPGRCVRVVAADANSLYADGKELLQRQILQPAMLRHHAMLHAAGVALGDRVIAVTGGKGAGKTTVQLHLASGGGDLVSADRLYLGLKTSDVQVHGYPARSCLAPDTFQRFPALGPSQSFEHDGAKSLVSLPTIAARLGSRVTPGGRLAAVLVATRTPGHADPMVAQLAGDGIVDALSGQWFGLADPIVPGWLGLIRKDRPRRSAVETAVQGAIAARVPVWQISTDALLTRAPDAARRGVEAALDG
jgi:hypothetical protein